MPAYSALQHRQLDILKPLGLAPEDVKLPLSPRSEDAYARINEEFDLLYSQLQDPGEQAGQNHTEVTKLFVHCALITHLRHSRRVQHSCLPMHAKLQQTALCDSFLQHGT